MTGVACHCLARHRRVPNGCVQPIFRAEKSHRNMFSVAGIDMVSLAQLKHAGGGDSCHSLSLSHDGSAISSPCSGLFMRGGGCMSVICGFVMCRGGSHSVTVGLGPGCGGLPCVVEAWGGPCFIRRDSHAFRGSRCNAGDWGGTWGMSGSHSSDSGMLGIGPVHCDVATGLVDPTGGLVHDAVGCGAGGVVSDVAGGWCGCWGVLGGLRGILSVVECCLVVVGTVPIVCDVALGE